MHSNAFWRRAIILQFNHLELKWRPWHDLVYFSLFYGPCFHRRLGGLFRETTHILHRLRDEPMISAKKLESSSAPSLIFIFIRNFKNVGSIDTRHYAAHAQWSQQVLPAQWSDVDHHQSSLDWQTEPGRFATASCAKINQSIIHSFNQSVSQSII